MIYDEAVLRVFLEKQGKLFDPAVAGTLEEVDAFLEDVCAEVFDSEEEMIEYLEDEMDVSEFSKEEILELEEVFAIGDGRFLVVEG